MLKLDDRDIAILRVLNKEGRISKSELAKRVNLSSSPCWERLKRLENAGVIRGYHADVELKKISPHIEVFIVVELEHHRAENFQTFERATNSCEEIVACWAIGGGFDYLLHIVTSEIDSYQRFMDQLLERPLGIRRYFSYVVTKPIKTGGNLPFDSLLPTDPKTK